MRGDDAKQNGDFVANIPEYGGNLAVEDHNISLAHPSTRRWNHLRVEGCARFKVLQQIIDGQFGLIDRWLL